jgi:erythromycin esterase
LEAIQYASVARQLLNYHAMLAQTSGTRVARLLGMRDAMMAENLAYMVSRERDRGKVFAFAHNNHLQRGRTQWQLGPDVLTWWPAGSHLTEMFGPRYAVIGSAVGVSEANGIGHPETGSLEARLTAVSGPARFIPARKLEAALSSPIKFLPIRSGNQKNPTYFPLTPQSITDFDWLAVLDSTTYARGGPSLS